jgi:predicted CopG family antitoxin
MGTKTISLTEEAYERLKAAKKEGESFSDVINRISPGVRLEEYWGILDGEAGDELREAVADGRSRRNATRSERRDRITDELSSDDTDAEQ